MEGVTISNSETEIEIYSDGTLFISISTDFIHEIETGSFSIEESRKIYEELRKVFGESG